jgi:hypothetical protein
MPSVANKLNMLSVVMVSVIMLSVVAPILWAPYLRHLGILSQARINSIFPFSGNIIKLF